jgi:hypothetical protein
VAKASKAKKKGTKLSVSRSRREDMIALAFNTLMRSLKHVKSSGPYTRDEMNER